MQQSSSNSKAHSGNLHSPQWFKSQNLAPGKEYGRKTVVHTWRTPTHGEIHGDNPSHCLHAWTVNVADEYIPD